MLKIYLISFVLLNSVFAFANDASFSFSGGTPTIEENNDVNMVSEHLIFNYVPHHSVSITEEECSGYYDSDEEECYIFTHWDARLQYVFRNNGPAQTLLIGLPFQFPPNDGMSDIVGPSAVDEISGFQTLIDGASAEVTEMNKTEHPALEFSRVYFVEVPFQAGQTRILTHIYQAYAGGNSSGAKHFNYILRTGANWAGPIEDVRIDFQLPSMTPCIESSLEFELDNTWMRIHRTNWIPDQDFEIEFLPIEAGLSGLGFDYYSDTTAEEFCASAPSDPALRIELAHRLERLYGAPLEETITERNALYLCRQNDNWIEAIHNEGSETRFNEMFRYRPQTTYPATMPEAIRGCVSILLQSIPAE